MKKDGSLTQGRDIKWGTGVKCGCGGELEVWPEVITPKSVRYSYECNSCKTNKGTWPPPRPRADR